MKIIELIIDESDETSGIEAISLVEQPALMSYYEMPKEKREEISIYDNLVRLSIGVEDAEDIIQDLHQALKPL